MLARLRPHLTYANVMVTIVTFIVLAGGTAVATHAPNLTTSEDIVDGEVKNPDLGADSVSSSKIQTQGVTTGDLAPNSVTGTRIAGDAVTSSEIQTSSVFNADLAPNSITDTRIDADAVGSSELKPDAVAAPEVAMDSLTDADIGPDAIGSSELTPDAVGGAEVAADSLNELDIADFRKRFTSAVDVDGGGPATFELDNRNGFVLTGSCERNEASGTGTGAVTMTHPGGTWRVDSNAPGGANDQTEVSASATRTLITTTGAIGPPENENYETGDFAAGTLSGTIGVNGLVAVWVNPNPSGALTQCGYTYARFG